MTLAGTVTNINAFIAAGNVTFTTVLNAIADVTLTVDINDNGNSGSGGALTDNLDVTLTVTAVNDEPAGTDNTVTTAEDTPYVFTTGDFGFSDPIDSPANNLLAVRVTTLPAVGTLTNNGARSAPVSSSRLRTSTPTSSRSHRQPTATARRTRASRSRFRTTAGF